MTALIKVDFPTLDRPMTATSGGPAAGSCAGAPQIFSKLARSAFNASP